jgi:hypothetical protein
LIASPEDVISVFNLMKMNWKKTRCGVLAGAFFVGPLALAETLVLDFSGAPLVEPEGVYNGADGAGGFESEGFQMQTTFTDFGGGFTAWSGVAASRLGDTLTPGFGNQYSAFPGGGADASGEAVANDPFGVIFVSGGSFSGALIEFPETGAPQSLMVANTTYAALSMLEGDAFTRPFGTPADNPDWFKLTIFGLNRAGLITGFVEHYLADFRPSEAASDAVQSGWVEVDLTGLGANVSALGFALVSTDQGDFGINTPTYAAIDRLVVEMPSAPLPVSQTLGGGWAVGQGGYTWHEPANGDWVYHWPLGWLWADRQAGDYQMRTPDDRSLDLSQYPRLQIGGRVLYLFNDSTPGALGYADLTAGTVTENAADLPAPLEQ